MYSKKASLKSLSIVCIHHIGCCPKLQSAACQKTTVLSINVSEVSEQHITNVLKIPKSASIEY